VDLLITHGPPKGFGSYSKYGRELGCTELLTHVQRANPIIHLFGHVHESYGTSTDHNTIFINAALLDKNKCVVFDLLPAKQSAIKIESPISEKTEY